MQVHHSAAPPGLVPFAVELFVLGFHCCLRQKTGDYPFLKESKMQLSIDFFEIANKMHNSKSFEPL